MTRPGLSFRQVANAIVWRLALSFISPLTSVISPATALSSSFAPSTAANSTSFGDTLQSAISQVNSLQLHAGALAQDFAVGKTSDVHGVMIAAEQATLALQLTTQVRNKAVEAYQQIMQISM